MCQKWHFFTHSGIFVYIARFYGTGLVHFEHCIHSPSSYNLLISCIAQMVAQTPRKHRLWIGKPWTGWIFRSTATLFLWRSRMGILGLRTILFPFCEDAPLFWFIVAMPSNLAESPNRYMTSANFVTYHGIKKMCAMSGPTQWAWKSNITQSPDFMCFFPTKSLWQSFLQLQKDEQVPLICQSANASRYFSHHFTAYMKPVCRPIT